jgi:hypothetical protein
VYRYDPSTASQLLSIQSLPNPDIHPQVLVKALQLPHHNGDAIKIHELRQIVNESLPLIMRNKPFYFLKEKGDLWHAEVRPESMGVWRGVSKGVEVSRKLPVLRPYSHKVVSGVVGL